MNKSKAAFFDRDGTLIHHVHYLSELAHVQLFSPAISVCKILADKGYRLFVVTNQSGIARGKFDEAFVEKTHTLVADLFKHHGVVFEKFYFCPHHPTEAIIPALKQFCACRKPNPGMLQTAADEFSLDLSQSLMFGDSLSDLQAGRAAGCTVFDIRTFFGKTHAECDRLLKKV